MLLAVVYILDPLLSLFLLSAELNYAIFSLRSYLDFLLL